MRPCSSDFRPPPRRGSSSADPWKPPLRTTSRCRPTGTEMREHRVGGHEKDEAPTGATAVLVGRQPYGARRAASVRLPPEPDRGAAAGVGAGVRVCAGGVQRRGRRPPGCAQAGVPYPTDAALSKALTAAKRTPERAWLAEVSAVVLQQALADANTAYRNFFASLKGMRRGRRVGAPRFRSRKDRAQYPFTRAALPTHVVRARWGSMPVRGSDICTSRCSVTVHGRKSRQPRHARKAAAKLRRAQKELARRQRGSANREKSRRKVARCYARVADTRRTGCTSCLPPWFGITN